MSRRVDYAAAADFGDYFARRLGAVMQQHQHSVSSWARSRLWRRPKKSRGAAVGFGANVVTRAAAPSSVVVGGLVAGTVISASAGFIAIPATAFAVATGVWGFKKYKGRQVNDEIRAFCDTHQILDKSTEDLVRYVRQPGNAPTAEQCRRWIGWFAFDGLSNMMETVGKAAETGNVASARLRVVNQRARERASDRTFMQAFLEAFDKLVYASYRIDRAIMYQKILLVVTVTWGSILVDDLGNLLEQQERQIERCGDIYDFCKQHYPNQPPAGVS